MTWDSFKQFAIRRNNLYTFCNLSIQNGPLRKKLRSLKKKWRPSGRTCRKSRKQFLSFCMPFILHMLSSLLSSFVFCFFFSFLAPFCPCILQSYLSCSLFFFKAADKAASESKFNGETL